MLGLAFLPASEALVLLQQHNSRRLGSDLCHAPGLCISCTKSLRAPLAELFYRSSNFVVLRKGLETAHKSAEPPDSDIASVFHAISLQSPELMPRSQSSVVIAEPLGEAGVKPQTIRGAAIC